MIIVWRNFGYREWEVASEFVIQLAWVGTLNIWRVDLATFGGRFWLLTSEIRL
jgi:hypothetical protein